MCIGPFAPKAPKMVSLPDLDAANRSATDQVSTPPEGRDVKTKQDIASVTYGTNKKQSGSAAASRTGTGALTIAKQMNTGNINQGNNTTGLNV